MLFIVNLILRVDYLNETVISKNKELENSLSELKQAHQKMSELNSELMKDKKRLNSNLKDMTGMNKRLEAQNREISTIHHEVHRRFDSTVGLLTNIIELNQSSRRGHSERVAEISAFIATQMGLTKIQIENIRTAARLHEIGIVSLPRDESIEDALDESHSRHLTSHPLVAEMLLKGFPGFEEIADIIRHMHENVDGTGKPDGLSGEAIPMGSRILSAASFYDHFQVEHPDSPVGEVLQKVEKESGRWFDENVVSFLSEYARILHPDKNETTIHCSVFALKEGMELASDIYSESGINLLRRGTVLDKEMVTRILKFNNVDPIAGQVVVKG
ncbi:MAG: HD domain-containing protein [Nitrospinaceae bacterium]|nr:HD domain-containing protein [Nitrospinaceae bacterium]NIR53551.1 HD domain-containing protein [Nitrospinaceae bacterium]NIS83952.1 HD domain-containing protein [Nitrospinaceae bacterium]NIT80761.1 HD domain-containing protein [Nitrospinaceae bacterium]NIU43067.1 HD domain-containing protein [Nitrospinaceae bacterium]